MSDHIDGPRQIGNPAADLTEYRREMSIRRRRAPPRCCTRPCCNEGRRTCNSPAHKYLSSQNKDGRLRCFSLQAKEPE